MENEEVKEYTIKTRIIYETLITVNAHSFEDGADLIELEEPLHPSPFKDEPFFTQGDWTQEVETEIIYT